MAVYERVVFSQAIGALDAPTELIDNNSGNDDGPYQLTVTPGLDETVPAQIRLYDAGRTVVDTAVDTDANLLERFDVPFDGPRRRDGARGIRRAQALDCHAGQRHQRPSCDG